MAITLGTVGPAAQNTTASNTLAVSFPATTTSGQVATLTVDVSSSTIGAANPTGWTLQASGNAGGSSPSIRVWTKTLDGTEGGTSVNVTGANATGQGRIVTWNGVDNTNHVDVVFTAFSSSTAVTAYTIPGATTTVPGDCLFYAAASNSATGTFTPPTVLGTWVEDVDVIATTPGLTIGHFIWSSSGATGNLNLTRSAGTRGVAVAIALQPAGSLTNVNAPASTATGAMTAPGVSGAAPIPVPAGGATGSMTAPGVSGGAVTIAAPAAGATAAMTAPGVSAGVNITAPAAVATASVTAPTYIAGVNILAPAMTAAGTVETPLIQVPVTVAVPAATATASMTAPIASVVVNIQAPAAGATAGMGAVKVYGRIDDITATAELEPRTWAAVATRDWDATTERNWKASL